METSTYTKRIGGSDMSGQLFEVKMAALLFLRCFNQSDADFFIASNTDSAGCLDDLVNSFQENKAAEWKSTFIQLKHIKKKTTMNQNPFVSQIRGSFSLTKYCDSFRKIKDEHPIDPFLQRCGDFNRFQFVLFTNALIDSHFLEGCKNVEADLHNLLKTGDDGRTVSLAEHDNIKKEFRKFFIVKEKLAVLLNDIDVCVSDEDATAKILKGAQQMMSELNEYLTIKELKPLLDNPTRDNLLTLIDTFKVTQDDATRAEFLSNFILAFNQANEVELDKLINDEIAKACWQSSDKELDKMRIEVITEVQAWIGDTASDKARLLDRKSLFWPRIVKSQMSKLSATKFEELSNYGLQFNVTPISPIDVFKKEIPHRGVMHVITEGGTSLSLIKIMSALHDETKICVTVTKLLDDEKNVLAAWKSVWCDYLVIDCAGDLAEDTHAPQVCMAIREIIENQTNKLVVIVTDESTNRFSKLLKMDINEYSEFRDMSYWRDISDESKDRLSSREFNLQGKKVSLGRSLYNDCHATSHLNGPTLSLLLKSELLLGKLQETPIDYYVPRTLRRKRNVAVGVDSVKDVEDRVVIVSAESGMGKSTLLTHLATSVKEEDEEMWVVRINLNDCTGYLHDLRMDNINELTAMEFLITFGTNNSGNLEEIMFKHRLKSNMVMLFVDGVDEVCPHYADKIMSLLHHLIQMQISRIWVTSRPIVEAVLEETLETESFQLQPFTDADQVDFLCKFWLSRNPDTDESLVRKYGEQLLQLTKNLYDVNFVIKVPLLAALLAEVYEDSMKESIKKNNLEFPKKLDLMHLYDAFVDKKFEIYFREKKEEDYTKPVNIHDREKIKQNIEQTYMHAALGVVLKNDFKTLIIKNREHLEIATEQFFEEIKLGKEKIGIIVNIIDNQPEFLHPTFADYFVAKWLTSNYQDNSDLMKKLSLFANFKVIRDIFDRSFARGFPLQTAVLNHDLSGIDAHVGSDVSVADIGGRTALHLVAMQSGIEKHSDYLGIAKLLLSNSASIEARDAILQWTPLQYADHTRAWSVAGLILQHGGDINELSSTKQSLNEVVYKELVAYIMYPGTCSLQLLRAAARYGDLEVIKFLAHEGGCDTAREMENDFEVMHLAAEGGCVETMSFLRELGVSFLSEDKYQNTPLHRAAAQGRSGAVEFLIAQGSDVNTRNNKRETPLILASQYDGDPFETVQCLVQRGAKVNDEDVDGRSALHFSAYTAGKPTVDFLLHAGCEVNKRSNDGSEPLHFAARGNQFDSMSCLLLNGANVNGVNNEGKTPLHYSAEMGETGMVKYLVERGSDINIQTQQGFTPLDLAAMCGELRTIQLLIDRNGIFNEARDVASSDEELDRNHLLLRAATQGDTHTCQVLLTEGADVNYYGRGVNSALHLASYQGHLETIKCLCDSNAVVGMRNKDEETALQIALHRDCDEVVVFLLQKENETLFSEKQSRIPIHFAAEVGSVSAIRYFIEKGVGVDSIDLSGSTCLNIASSFGNLDVVRFLIDDLQASMIGDHDGFTPLHAAARSGHLSIVKLLIERKVNINGLTRANETALYLVSQLGRLDMVELLTSHDAHFNTPNSLYTPLEIAAAEGHVPVVEYFHSRDGAHTTNLTTGDTLLHLAAANGRLETVNFLIDKGYNAMEYNKNHFLPIHLASQRGHSDIVECLLDLGIVPVNVPGFKDRTSLFLASRSGKLKVVELLLKRGAEVMTRDKKRYTPLHVASVEGHREIADRLLRHGADVNDAMNKMGETPLLLAAMEGRLKVVKLLLCHEARVDIATRRGITPLQVSAKYGRLTVVKHLTEHDAPEVSEKLLAIQIAAEREHNVEVVEYLQSLR